MREKLTKEKLYKMYIVENKTAREIAENTGYCRTTISQYLSKNGLKKGGSRGKRVQENDIPEIIEMYNNNMSTYQIGDRLGYKSSTVGAALKRKGVKLRNAGIDIIGKKFGKLTVLEKIDSQIYICECECGITREFKKKRLLDKRNTSCGCFMNRRGHENGSWTGYEGITGRFWASIKCGAENRGVDLKLSIQDAWGIYIQQDKKCALSNQDIIMPDKQYSKGEAVHGLASLDRIDSSKMYTKENCQWIMREINYMKMDIEQERFIELCKMVGGCS